MHIINTYIYMQNNEKQFWTIWNLQAKWFKIDLSKKDTHRVRVPKRRKDNQSQSLKYPCRLSQLGCKPDTMEFHGNMFNPVFTRKPGNRTSHKIFYSGLVMELNIQRHHTYQNLSDRPWWDTAIPMWIITVISRHITQSEICMNF